MENIRGFLTNAGPMTVQLMSWEQIHEQRTPETPVSVSIDWNPQDLRPGDQVIVKPRPDWEMPAPYRLAGETATVYAMFEVPGYVFLLFDNDCTGLDPRIPVGFAIENLARA
jgi:hypothetical protein